MHAHKSCLEARRNCLLRSRSGNACGSWSSPAPGPGRVPFLPLPCAGFGPIQTWLAMPPLKLKIVIIDGEGIIGDFFVRRIAKLDNSRKSAVIIIGFTDKDVRMLDDLGRGHLHDFLEKGVMALVGADRADDAVDDEDIVGIHFLARQLAAHRLAEQRGRNERPALVGADASGDDGFRLADPRHAAQSDDLVAVPLEDFAEEIDEQSQLVPREAERLAIIRIPFDITSVTHSKPIHQARRTQLVDGDVLYLGKHLAENLDFFVVVGLKQHAAGAVLHPVDRNDVDVEHAEQGGDIPKQARPVLMYFVLHIPLFGFH
ncbi:hypothetical protein BN871_KV_00040 [Paenibacillus sp. P22]|nr:hypothetical protein BN871_KV_00040 [Paenibacillus sp. P22]